MKRIVYKRFHHKERGDKDWRHIKEVDGKFYCSKPFTRYIHLSSCRNWAQIDNVFKQSFIEVACRYADEKPLTEVQYLDKIRMNFRY